MQGFHFILYISVFKTFATFSQGGYSTISTLYFTHDFNLNYASTGYTGTHVECNTCFTLQQIITPVLI
jgi:hypothetical protein